MVLADDTEPEPDVTVLRQRSYKHAEPAVADVLLLIEVAETSLRYDRVTKRPLYAEAGVPEYWIVDCGAESIELHRGPGGEEGNPARVPLPKDGSYRIFA